VLGTLGNDERVRRTARDQYHGRGGMAALDPNVFAAVLAIVAHAGGEIEYANS